MFAAYVRVEKNTPHPPNLMYRVLHAQSVENVEKSKAWQAFHA